jgi:hypothetical protein
MPFLVQTEFKFEKLQVSQANPNKTNPEIKPKFLPQGQLSWPVSELQAHGG